MLRTPVKTRNRIQIEGTLAAAALAALATASPARAASMSASLTAPAVNGLDIALLRPVGSIDKWYY